VWDRLQELVAQTCFSRSAAFLTDRAQVPRTYKTGPRYTCFTVCSTFTARCWRSAR
jgi:hypothetical protein